MVQLCEKGTADLMVIKGAYLQRGTVIHTTTIGPLPRVFFIETKSTKGKLSLAQEAFRDMVVAQGAEYLLVKDADEMIKVLE